MHYVYILSLCWNIVVDLLFRFDCSEIHWTHINNLFYFSLFSPDCWYCSEAGQNKERSQYCGESEADSWQTVRLGLCYPHPPPKSNLTLELIGQDRWPFVKASNYTFLPTNFHLQLSVKVCTPSGQQRNVIRVRLPFWGRNHALLHLVLSCLVIQDL